MSYEVKRIFIRCPICEHKITSEPKNLACGESICRACSLRLMKSVSLEASRYDCLVCHTSHELPQGRELPVNKMLSDVFKHSETSRSNLALQFTGQLNKCLAKVYELENMFANNGVDKVKDYCHNLRIDVHLAAEKRIGLIHEQCEKLLVEINEFESQCVQKISNP